MRIITLCLFLIFTNPYLFNICVRSWQSEKPKLVEGKQYSAAILLGGITSLDKYDTSYFGPDADRFIQATKLYHSGIVSHIAVTGGSPALFKKRKAEALQLKEALLQQGIPDSAIIIESLARNTFENAAFIKKKLDSSRLSSPYLLVTSAMHVPRAVAVFKKAGVDVIGYPSAFKALDYKWCILDYIIPSFDLLFSWPSFLKEVIGFKMYKLTGKA